jgi:hypothetical protein
MHPSALPDYPGLEVKIAKATPLESYSRTLASIGLAALSLALTSSAPLETAQFSTLKLNSEISLSVLSPKYFLMRKFLNGMASILTMELLTRVLVLTSSGSEGWKATLMILVLKTAASDYQTKFPALSLKALNL